MGPVKENIMENVLFRGVSLTNFKGKKKKHYVVHWSSFSRPEGLLKKGKMVQFEGGGGGGGAGTISRWVGPKNRTTPPARFPSLELD